MRAKRGKAAAETPKVILQVVEGFDRNRLYTREEICRHFDYDGAGRPHADRLAVHYNGPRYSKKHFLDRVLPVIPVGKTFLVSGEALWYWVTQRTSGVQFLKTNRLRIAGGALPALGKRWPPSFSRFLRRLIFRREGF